ncbi:FMRFamide neuropeptides [Plakobranchus ocellatus]|uniref:FMRFamide neuropeptides n=1 Tax=Plakobranchus ocellatus TaxID=259542 RepID=A0AAV3ZG61_9GAST|nr:FMRFamide neuropeptides [Plakobranchus ocellatus]
MLRMGYLSDGPYDRARRQFMRFGRSDNLDDYHDKRFLRFGRKPAASETEAEAYIQALLQEQDEGPLYRKKRSLEKNAGSKDQSEHELLKRSRRSAEVSDLGDNGLFNEAQKGLQKRNVDLSDIDEEKNLGSDLDEGTAPHVDKRFMRFGKSYDSLDDLADKRFMRFGKRFMRFGKSYDDLADKRFMRFGKRDSLSDKRFMRFGKSADSLSDKRFMRFGKSADSLSDKRFMRFGKRANSLSDKRFMRFGKSADSFSDKRFMRFGKSYNGISGDSVLPFGSNIEDGGADKEFQRFDKRFIV